MVSPNPISTPRPEFSVVSFLSAPVKLSYDGFLQNVLLSSDDGTEKEKILQLAAVLQDEENTRPRSDSDLSIIGSNTRVAPKTMRPPERRRGTPEAGGENPNRALTTTTTTTTCRRAIESDRHLKPRAGFSRRTEAECSVVFEWRSAFACPVESYPRINFVVNGDYHSSTAGVMVGLLVLAVVLSVAYLYLRKPANRSQLRSKLSSLCPGRRHEGFFQYSRDRCGQSYHHLAVTLAQPSVEGLRLAKGAQQIPRKAESLFLVCGHWPWLKATEEASLLIHDPAESDSDDDELLGV
uniref:Uncharacterized protein n=1 Tax=Timema shepardi TaxID=629360 RepID=A0A7R9FW08_TIMSH|nr:unnamed protein product [Timema shepardi]